jgi:hypothetical protein
MSIIAGPLDGQTDKVKGVGAKVLRGMQVLNERERADETVSLIPSERRLLFCEEVDRLTARAGHFEFPHLPCTLSPLSLT